jgi:hypothetical protein
MWTPFGQPIEKQREEKSFGLTDIRKEKTKNKRTCLNASIAPIAWPTSAKSVEE